MIHQNLQLAAALDAAGVANVTRALRGIAGIVNAAASDGTSRVAVVYDDESTSPQEIAAALARAGHPLREAPKSGGCCGSCSGGGH